MERYLKFVQYTVLAVLGGIAAALTSGGVIDGPEWANLAVLTVTAAVVWWQRNTPDQPHAKAAVAVAGAGLTVLTSAWTDGRIELTEVVMIVMALIGAVQVGTVANVPPGPQPEASQDPITAGVAGAGDGNTSDGGTTFYDGGYRPAP